MSAFRKYPVFSSVLTLCAVLAVGEGWLIYDRYAASRDAAAKVVQKEAELLAMRDLAPVPTRAVATAIEADLARAQRAVATMQTELKGRGPAAERMAAAKVPTARTEAYFDLATFVEKTREQAKKLEVELRPEASRFGFALYANEGPKEDRMASVFHQRQIIQYIVESLLDARPRALLAVQRERALSKSELEAIAAAQAAAAAAIAAGGAPEPMPEIVGTGSPPEQESPDIFVLDPRVTARSAGYLNTTPVRVVFTGQTATLRTFLNKLASFELPILVREVEVDSASVEESAPIAPAATDDAADASAASVVLTATPKVAPKPVVPTAKVSSAVPIVTKALSKFTVTLEHLDLVTAPAAPAEAPAADAKPTT